MKVCCLMTMLSAVIDVGASELGECPPTLVMVHRHRWLFCGSGADQVRTHGPRSSAGHWRPTVTCLAHGLLALACGIAAGIICTGVFGATAVLIGAAYEQAQRACRTSYVEGVG